MVVQSILKPNPNQFSCITGGGGWWGGNTVCCHRERSGGAYWSVSLCIATGSALPIHIHLHSWVEFEVWHVHWSDEHMEKLAHSCPSTEHGWASPGGGSINFRSTAWHGEIDGQYHVKSVCRTVGIKSHPYISQLPVKELYRVHLLKTIQKTEK